MGSSFCHNSYMYDPLHLLYINKMDLCLFERFHSNVSVEGSSMEAFSTEQPITSSDTRMPQSPRRPTHQLPPRLNIHPAPTSELGPPAQVQV